MKTGKTASRTLLFFLAFSLLIWTGITKTAEAAKTLLATISSEKVEKGNIIRITSKVKGLAYKSSDTAIAYVNQNGVIIGKKKGIAAITVSKEGFDPKKFTITVTTNGKSPNIYVWCEEIELVDEQVHDGIYTAYIKNNSNEELDKVEYVFEAEVETVTDFTENSEAASVMSDEITSETENISADLGASTQKSSEGNTQSISEIQTTMVKHSTLKVSASNISAGKAKKIKLEAPDNGKIKTIDLQKVYVYTKSALIVYDAKKNSYTYGWSTKDKKAPVISGLVGEDSYFDDTIFMVVYPDKKYDFTKYVTAEDDRDLKVSLSVDTSKINYKKEGSYKITFTAVDNAGNKSIADAKVYVRLPKKIDKMADEVLETIVKDTMTDQEKATAVYTYIRKNFSYAGNYEEDNWEEAALYGLRYKSGDCFMYYSASKLLLTRLGIPNIMVTRYRGEGHHWWNLVYVEGGWYHFDSTPRSIMATFCLVTSAQLEEYSTKAGNTHIWNTTKYPDTAIKKISKVVMKKRY